MNAERRALGLALYDIGGVLDRKRSPEGKGFRLKLHERDATAPLSPFYLNLRTPDNPKPGPLTPELVRESAQHLWTLATEQRVHDVHCVAGVPRAGDPFARALSERVGIPFLTLRKEESGARREVTGIDGIATAGHKVLLLDDLVTKADSKLEAIKVLEGAGLTVRAVLVLVDREQGGAAELNARGYALHTLFTITALLDLYVAEGRMTDAERTDIVTYLRENS